MEAARRGARELTYQLEPRKDGPEADDVEAKNDEHGIPQGGISPSTLNNRAALARYAISAALPFPSGSVDGDGAKFLSAEDA